MIPSLLWKTPWHSYPSNWEWRVTIAPSLPCLGFVAAQSTTWTRQKRRSLSWDPGTGPHPSSALARQARAARPRALQGAGSQLAHGRPRAPGGSCRPQAQGRGTQPGPRSRESSQSPTAMGQLPGRGLEKKSEAVNYTSTARGGWAPRPASGGTARRSYKRWKGCRRLRGPVPQQRGEAGDPPRAQGRPRGAGRAREHGLEQRPPRASHVQAVVVQPQLTPHPEGQDSQDLQGLQQSSG